MVSKAGFTVTTQYNLRWLHQEAGLSRFGPDGCLTELGIVHQGVARQEKEAREGVPAGPKRDNPAVN